MEWQSEQEKRESKSLYHSEKESLYTPVIGKTSSAIQEIKDDETGETESPTKSGRSDEGSEQRKS